MLDILCKHSFCDFVKMVSSLFLLQLTTKINSFSPCEEDTNIADLTSNKYNHKSQIFTSKHRVVKNLQIANTFSKNVNKETISSSH